MSAPDQSAFHAVAGQLLAALERYAYGSGQMIADWPDLERYRAVSEQIEEIRVHATALPDVRAQWVELLIAHAELVHLLWRVQFGHDGVTRDDTVRVKARHADALAALRDRCMRIAHPAGDGSAPGP